MEVVISTVMLIGANKMPTLGFLLLIGRRIMIRDLNNSTDLAFSIILLPHYSLTVSQSLKKPYKPYKPSNHHIINQKTSSLNPSYSKASFSNIHFKLFLLSSTFLFTSSLFMMANLYELIYL